MSGTGRIAAQRCLQQRLPAGDPAWLRTVAGRSNGLAAELRRLGSQLSGCLQSGGWSGSGQRAFAQSMTGRVPELTVIAGRYEQYGAALLGYAGALDRLQPTLAGLHRQLADACAQPPSDPSDDPRLHRLAGQFERAREDWQSALRRCQHALATAAAIERDEHGWASFGHHVLGALETISPVVALVEDPSLAGLSRVLGDLGTELAVVGLVLLVVCPPAAGVCFALAAVVSVAQLATDSVRAARHDPGVGALGLGLDALGALPGGRVVREAEQGARVARGLDALAARSVVSRLVPGGGLAAHEAAGGHTLARHVGKSLEYLTNRFSEVPKPSMASAFYSRAHAEHAIAELLEARTSKITRWLDGSASYAKVSGRAVGHIGVSLAESSRQAHAVSGLLIVLRRDPSMTNGYHIYTAYPQP